MKAKWVVGVVVLLACAFLVTSVTWAQEGGPAKPKELTFWDSVKAGGAIGHFIILLSVVMLSLAIMFTMEIRRDNLVPPDLHGRLVDLFEEEDYEEAMTVCQATPTFFTNVVAAALPYVSAGYDQIQSALDEATSNESLYLSQKIGYLQLIGSLAPMLGLLGTVTGMIGAFNTIASKAGAANAADLAYNISQALVTTFEGLTVAIPAVSAYFFLRNRVTKMTIEVGLYANELMDRFRGQ